MADYIDSEAEESDEEEEDLSPQQKSKLKKIKREEEDEEDEEDGSLSELEDEERLAEEMKDLIDDNDLEEEESDNDSEIGKRKREEEEDDDFDDRLEDDDYDLIEENLGVKVQRKKFRRLQQLEDDESDDEENRDNLQGADDREVIANALFEGDDEEVESIQRSRADAGDDYDDIAEGDDEEYSDTDDFIVDDDGQPLTKTKRRRPRFTDQALQQAQDIFGVDFDFNEFEAYGEDYEEEVDEDLEYEEEPDVETRRRPKKAPRKKHTRKSIFEIYEPSELERGHFTDKDNEIRATDIPERFQLRGVPVTPAEDAELDEEAEWIYKHAFSSPTISTQEMDTKPTKEEPGSNSDVDIWNEKTETKEKPTDSDDVGGGGDVGEDWDTDEPAATNKTSAAAAEEDWDSEVTESKPAVAPKSGGGGEDWDEEIKASEDWDEEAGSAPSAKTASTKTTATVKPSDGWDSGINCSENWDDEIKGSEDWSEEMTDKPKVAASATAPPVDKGPVIKSNEDWDTEIQGMEDWDAGSDGGMTTADAADDAASVVPGKVVPPPPKETATNWEADKKRLNTVKKIREALNFMRNQHFEVPFIAFYRKEYVEPELNINDLWKVFLWDEKWCQLSARKKNLLRLFQKMQEYQCDEVMRDPDQPLSDDMRVLSDEDFERLKGVQTFEELKDAYYHFTLYYGHDVPRMQETLRKKQQAEREQNRRRHRENGDNEDGDEPEEEDKEEDVTVEERVKQASRVDAYTLCRRAGLAGLAKKFGLTPQQIGENLRDNYQRHEVEQYPIEPLEAAQEYVNPKFMTPEDVLRGARFMVATQIAKEPLVRQCIRTTFFERAKICVKATKKGIKEIDEHHPCYTMKYLRNKPVKDLKGDAFLKLVIAETDGLLTIGLGMDMEGKSLGNALMSYVDEIKQLYHRDEFSKNVQEWNKQRSMALEVSLTKFLYPVLQKELRMRLIQESQDCIIRASCRKLYNWLKVAPFVPEAMDDDEDYDISNGIRVLGIAYVPDWETAGFGALVDVDGEVAEFIRLPHIMKRKNAWKENDRENKASELDNIKRFISEKKPHVIVIGAESREAMTIVEDIKVVVNELVESEQMPLINVELMDNELSKVFMNSKKAENDFREYPPLLKQAVSLARRMQDPLIEFAQLCNPDVEILCLKYHSLQDKVPSDDLLHAIYLEFVNRTNEVGVDVNRCIAHPHTANLVQFICGLGPRKGLALLKTLKQMNSRLENRTQLVTVCHMGPKVFINCAGFIKIDTSSLGDSTEAYVEVLDGSRVHPETYEWARKMAVDALEYDDMAEDANPAGALEEILDNPEKLKDLDLDAFAEELERQGFGNKSITLYDIRAELNNRYKDLRTSYRPSNSEERFNMLTKETPDTFYIGKLVLAKVIGIARKKPQGEQLDQANPVRNDETGLWQCPFCLKNDFLEVSEVWNHFDADNCPGQATGVKARLDNGVFGFIPTKFISDKHVTNPEERVREGMTCHCRIVKIDIERFQVDLTCRSSDLADKNSEWRPAKDVYYDFEAEEKDNKKDEETRKRQTRQTYIKRVIVHPSFHNISFKEAEKLLANMEQGEVIVRPSSKGSDHLTITWKVADNIYQHIDVREEGKENAFSLGQSLWINNEEFEDLDEIIARHVQPMAAFARDLLTFRYYREAGGGKRDVIEKLLSEEKKKMPAKIHYFISASKEYPGKFLLSYLPRVKSRHEYITTTPDGLRYRSHMFHSVNQLIRWFKEHFRDPIPGTPNSATGRTPAGGQSVPVGSTPSINLASLDPQAIKRAAQNLPRHMVNTLTQVANQTPSVAGAQYSSRYGTYSYHPTTPYTPSQPISTPMLTPSYHALATPSHAITTPSHTMATPSHTMATPSQHVMHTPRYHPTPQTNWAHPTQAPSRAPSRSTASTTSNVGTSNRSVAASETDWKKAAELWAKRQQMKQQGGITPRGTPRASPSIRGGSTPMIDNMPAGDATPLIDEH